jgi:tetratricopeptide (TPR) repeat protein
MIHFLAGRINRESRNRGSSRVRVGWVALVLGVTLLSVEISLPSGNAYATSFCQDAEPKQTLPPVPEQTATEGAVATEEEQSIWIESVDTALELAAANSKDILIDFTGSDWCPPCMALEEKVFSQSAFRKAAPDNFILVKCDNPRNEPNVSKQSAEAKAQFDKWSKKFTISGFPTVMLLDSKGLPYASATGFQDQSPEDYLKQLDELRQIRVRRDELLAEAQTKTGLEKAQALDRALSELNGDLITGYYADIIKELVELDAKDEAGLRTKYYAAQDKEARKALLTEVSMAARSLSPELALVAIDKAIGKATLPASVKLEAMQHKLRIYTKLKRSDDASKLIDEMIGLEGIDPELRSRMLVQKAYMLVSAKKPDDAFQLLDQAIGTSLQNLDLFIAKGDLLSRMGKQDEAVQTFDKIIPQLAGNGEKLAEVVALKADSLIALDRMDDALKAIDQFIESKRNSELLRAEMLVQKSTLLLEADRKDEALAAQKQALDLIEEPTDKRAIEQLIKQANK